MMKLMDNGITQLLGVFRDDLAADSTFVFPVHIVPDGRGEVTVDNAKQYRFDLIAVDEIRNKCHRNIQHENHGKKVECRQHKGFLPFFTKKRPSSGL
jgi:hypothetical protein